MGATAAAAAVAVTDLEFPPPPPPPPRALQAMAAAKSNSTPTAAAAASGITSGLTASHLLSSGLLMKHFRTAQPRRRPANPADATQQQQQPRSATLTVAMTEGNRLC